MNLSKKALDAALAKIRKQAESYGETAKQARYQNDEASAQYYDGLRVGNLQAALEIEATLGL
jgi:hypothetical protein